MKIVLFDFDGVIANSQTAVLNAYNEIAKLKNIPPISKDEFLNMSTRDLLKYFKIKWFQIWYYVRLLRKILLSNINEIYLEREIEIFFNRVSKNDSKFIILSSNSEKLINEFLSRKSNDKVHFSDTIGNVSIFKKNKKINEVRRKLKINNTDILYVGDEVRDIIAAQKSNIRSVAVLWGKDSEKLLINSKPNFIAKNGHDLAEIIDRFSDES